MSDRTSKKLRKEAHRMTQKRVINDYKAFCQLINAQPFHKRIVLSLAVMLGRL